MVEDDACDNMEDDTCELTYFLTEEQYFEAEKMAKKHGYKTVAEFALYCMQRYINSESKN